MGSSIFDQSQIRQVAEDNILTLLDISDLGSASDIEDDKLSFLEAVYSLSIVPEAAKVPTRKIYEAIFTILEENSSMVLNLASYLLLVELDKRYAQQNDEALLNPVASQTRKDATFYKMTWSPFSQMDRDDRTVKHRQQRRSSDSGMCDHETFVSLMKNILNEIQKEQDMLSGSTTGKKSGDELSTIPTYQTFGLILKLKYIVSIIERDFRSRRQIFHATQNMDALTNAFLSQIFKGGSQNKVVVRLLLHLIAASGFYREEEEDCSVEEMKCLKYMDLQAGYLELADFCSSIQSLTLMVMDFDTEYSKKLESSPKKSRQGSQWVSVWELITEVIGRETHLLAPLLQVMEPPHYKLKIIFSFFIKYAPQPIVKHVREKPEKLTVQGFFNYFGQLKDVKSIYKTIETEIIQLLLANAFKASLTQHVYKNHSGIGTSILEVCSSLMTAFENLQTVSSDFELHSSGKGALLTADIISSCVT